LTIRRCVSRAWLPRFVKVMPHDYKRALRELAERDAVADVRLREGELVLMTGMGAGLTWGSALIEWTPSQMNRQMDIERKVA
jgi:hypothetical protein